MKVEEIKAAKAEAERFIERASECIEEQAKRSMSNNSWAYSCPKESGALRRASLDLTRQLAKMRKP
jgi:hypothetical protein